MPKARIAVMVYCLAILAGMSGTTFAKNNVFMNGLVLDVTAPEPVVPSELAATLPADAQKWIVQFAGPVSEQDKIQLEAAGGRIGGYLPDYAFIVSMRGSVMEEVKKLPFVTGVIPYRPAYKIDRKLKNEDGTVRVEAGKKALLNVMIDNSANIPAVVAETLNKKGRVADLSGQMVRLEIDSAEIANLAKFEEVLWVEEAASHQAANDTTNWVIQTYDRAASTRIWLKGLQGEGQLIGIGDTGLDYDLPWFADPSGVPIGPSHRKIIGYDPTWGDAYDGDYGHGTHVSGTAGGDRTPVDGMSSANGIAIKSRLFIQDLTAGNGNNVNTPSDLGFLFSKAYDAGVRIHTNSWTSLNNSYTNGAMTADRFLWEHRDFLAIFANGNSGPFLNSVGSPASAKNVISVGASFNGENAESIADFSSCGPTSDGRIKPTVVAPGVDIVSANSDGLFNGTTPSTILTRTMSGTSMATPAVAGAASLVRQYFTDGYYPSGAATRGDARNPSAALIKAVIVNCAQNMSGEMTKGSIPSMGQGWGRINLSNTLAFTGDGKALVVADESAALVTGESWSKTYYVSGSGQLKATLVWTDYPATLGAARALVNDLDLKVTGPDGTTWLGNVFLGGVSQPGGAEDRLNVEEQVLLPFPAKGQYTVTVSAPNIPHGPQPFALVVSGAAEVSSKGTIFFDRGNYTSTGNVQIRIVDADLDKDSASADTTTVVVKNGGGEEESVTLTETAADSGIFTGSLSLVAGTTSSPTDGTLGVADGGVITATYTDLDDGSGHSATITAAAKIDNVRPLISAVSVAAQDGSAKVRWATNEPASSSVSFFTTPGSGAATVTDQRLVTDHTITLGALEESTEYSFFLCATDEAGNTECTDRTNPSVFTTASIPPQVVIDALSATSTYSDRIQIHGSVRDYSGIDSLTVNGVPVPFGASDGFYEKIVNLNEGANDITVEATDKKGNKGTATVRVTRLVAPDLVVRSVTAVSGSAITGGYIIVEDTVCNDGFGNSLETSVGFALSVDDVVTKGDPFIGSRKIPSLAPNSCSSGTSYVMVPAAIGSGTYYLGASADYMTVQPESDETNNTRIGNTTLNVQGGDIIPVSLVGPMTGVPGGDVRFTSLIKNKGPGVVGTFHVSLFLLSETGTYAGSFAGYEVVPGLAAAVERAFQTSGTIPADVAAGSYSVCIRVDSENEVREQDEENNVLCSGKLVVAVPDLQVSLVSGPPAARLGQMVSVNVTVRNTSAAGYALPSTLNLYLHPEQGPDILAGSRLVEGLPPGQSSTGQVVFTIQDTVPTGVYILRAVADVSGAVAEASETNNTLDGNVIIIGPAEVPNVVPAIRTMTAPAEPVQLGSSVMFSARFDDPGTDETHVATVDWGDGTSSAATIQTLSGDITATHVAIASHTYTAAGVYTLLVTITDSRGGSTTGKYTYVVIFDPDGGYVTGGGWINSPAGAIADTSASGKAAYGFVSRYKQGAITPSGNTEFQFKAGNLDFRSATYDWLVVAGAKAMYKGTGTINGSGEYGFLLTATDGQLKLDGKDTLRMKIWNKVNGGVVYDNERGIDETQDPTTPIQEGNIIVRKK